jgi:hypothetical protein
LSLIVFASLSQKKVEAYKMVKLTKMKVADQRKKKEIRALDERIAYERLRDGLRLEHKLSFQK